jgi:hypothetical protein
LHWSSDRLVLPHHPEFLDQVVAELTPRSAGCWPSASQRVPSVCSIGRGCACASPHSSATLAAHRCIAFRLPYDSLWNRFQIYPKKEQRPAPALFSLLRFTALYLRWRQRRPFRHMRWYSRTTGRFKS